MIWRKITTNPSKFLADNITGELEHYINQQGNADYGVISDEYSSMETKAHLQTCDTSILNEPLSSGELSIVVKQGVPYQRRMNSE